MTPTVRSAWCPAAPGILGEVGVEWDWSRAERVHKGWTGRGAEGSCLSHLAHDVLDEAGSDAVVPLMAVTLAGVFPRGSRQPGRGEDAAVAAVVDVDRRQGPAPVALPVRLPAPEVGLVQQEGVRELAEADEEGRNPGEQNQGPLVPAAQPPEEGQHRAVVVEEQRAAGGGG